MKMSGCIKRQTTNQVKIAVFLFDMQSIILFYILTFILFINSFDIAKTILVGEVNAIQIPEFSLIFQHSIYNIKSIMSNGLKIMIHIMIICLTSSKLLIGKHLIVSKNLEIILRNKFRFTDVLMSNSARKAISNTSNYKRIADLPEIPIRHQGRQQPKYHQISQTLGAYLIRAAVDEQQLKDEFETTQNNQEKYDFYLVPEEFRQELNEISQNKIVCFYEKDFEKMGIASFLSSCSLLETKQQLNSSFDELGVDQKDSQVGQKQIFFLLTFSLVLCGIFISLKFLIYFRISKNNSGI